MYRSAAENAPRVRYYIVTVAAAIAVFAYVSLAGQAKAETFKVCNATAEKVLVSIVYSMGDARNYISKGWWSLAPNGGCATVLNGALPIKGVFLRGEAPGKVWEGTMLFCVLPHGELANANNLDDKACTARGGTTKAYEMHVIKTSVFTTTLRTPGGSSGSGRAPQPSAGFGNDVQGCAADAPCFQEAYQSGNKVIFKFNGVQGFDFYNVRYDNGHQVENRSGMYTLTNVQANRTYRISVQGCKSHVLAHSTCSAWVSQAVSTK